MHTRLFRYLNRNMAKSLGIFWIIIIISNILATVISYNIFPDVIFNSITINNEIVTLSDPYSGTMTLVGNNLFTIPIFFIVYGIIGYYQYFPLTGAFGVTRKNFYIHTILNNLIIVGVSALIQILLLKVDNIFMESLGYRPIVDFRLFNMNDNILLNIIILAFVYLVFSSLLNLLGVLVYRFSYRAWIGLGIAGIISGLSLRGLGGFLATIAQAGFWAGLIVILLSYSLGFLIFRRVDIK